MSRSRVTPFVAGYVKAALGASSHYGIPLDNNYTFADFAPGAAAQMETEAIEFYREHERELAEREEEAGFDFWLTRNRDGAGFWDGDWPEPLATHLTDAAHAAGERELYMGDDGQIYITPASSFHHGPPRLNAARGAKMPTGTKVALGAAALGFAGLAAYLLHTPRA